MPLAGLTFAILLMMIAQAAAEDATRHSPYAGEGAREIAPLSAGDLEELARGGGWGVGRAAGPNGVPDREILARLVEEAGTALRLVHLSAHRSQAALPTEVQAPRDHVLRGCADGPCEAVPEGHNAAIWTRHKVCGSARRRSDVPTSLLAGDTLGRYMACFASCSP